ncbi:hypothetical protein LWI29_027512 [Acer saccharum]|uniref:Uncharacterized protein n=1 Tax=Acer saccharum TaxID=4024 RepID=A0AA39SA44_ACESA|nr:hypothetical protein LWI29_027512 [Acer saccharum]
MLGWNHPSVKETSKSKKLKREKGREREIAVRRRERSPPVTAGRCRCCSQSLSSPSCRSSSPSLQRENGRETAVVHRRRRLPLSYPYPALKVIKVLQLRHLLNMEQHHTGDNMVSLMDAWLLYIATALLIKFVAIPTALLIKFVAIPTVLG